MNYWGSVNFSRYFLTAGILVSAALLGFGTILLFFPNLVFTALALYFSVLGTVSLFSILKTICKH